jgi:hypothetical protein
MNEAVRESLRKAGLDRAAQFDWRRTAEQTLEIYRRAAHPATVSDRLAFFTQPSSPLKQ